jgi:ribosome biogenesis GTPase
MRSAAKRRPQHTESEAELKPGLVVANYGASVDVKTSHQITRCFVRTNLEVVTGDRVLWRDETEQGVVEAREERESEIHRPDIYGKLRTVAANVSQLLITIAPVPEPHPSMIDRYLVAAHQHGLNAIIVINKSDRNENAETIQAITDLYSGLDIAVIAVSAKTGSGIANLESKLIDGCSIFVGQSGVGKSSLIAQILPAEDILVGELSEAAGKGKHTTTLSQLYELPNGGTCIDSPGIREFGLWHVEPDTLLGAFDEIAEQAQYCKFRDCSHNGEPKCAVKQALENGTISQQRFDSYLTILKQLDDITIQTPR